MKIRCEIVVNNYDSALTLIDVEELRHYLLDFFGDSDTSHELADQDVVMELTKFEIVQEKTS